jgi:serine/threonine protein kinase
LGSKTDHPPLHSNFAVYRGSFATVKRAVNKKTGEKVAIKIISK